MFLFQIILEETVIFKMRGGSKKLGHDGRRRNCRRSVSYEYLLLPYTVSFLVGFL
jgi:hypothetical protein